MEVDDPPKEDVGDTVSASPLVARGVRLVRSVGEEVDLMERGDLLFAATARIWRHISKVVMIFYCWLHLKKCTRCVKCVRFICQN